MKTSVMNFTVDRQNNKVKVEREFAAPLANVWAAWTQAELLDQWWAPKPWKARTKTMDFREGGHWLYAMVGPQGEQHWARADYYSVQPQKSFSLKDAFTDENGNVNSELPGSSWANTFRQTGDSTRVTVEITYQSLADLEKYIELGFREGFTAALENLDELLQA